MNLYMNGTSTNNPTELLQRYAGSPDSDTDLALLGQLLTGEVSRITLGDGLEVSTTPPMTDFLFDISGGADITPGVAPKTWQAQTYSILQESADLALGTGAWSAGMRVRGLRLDPQPALVVYCEAVAAHRQEGRRLVVLKMREGWIDNHKGRSLQVYLYNDWPSLVAHFNPATQGDDLAGLNTLHPFDTERLGCMLTDWCLSGTLGDPERRPDRASAAAPDVNWPFALDSDLELYCDETNWTIEELLEGHDPQMQTWLSLNGTSTRTATPDSPGWQDRGLFMEAVIMVERALAGEIVSLPGGLELSQEPPVWRHTVEVECTVRVHLTIEGNLDAETALEAARYELQGSGCGDSLSFDLYVGEVDCEVEFHDIECDNIDDATVIESEEVKD